MFKKAWFTKHLARLVSSDYRGRIEAAINLTPQAWAWQCFVIGQGNGFTHNDMDKPLLMHLQKSLLAEEEKNKKSVQIGSFKNKCIF